MTAVLEDVSQETYDSWGTLNTAAPPTKLTKDHTPRAFNVFPDEKPGSIVTVPGWKQIGTLPSGNPCRFLYTFEKSDGTSIVLCSDNATVYKTADFITYTSIITGLSQAFQLRATTLRDKVWLTNGNDSVRTYDGSSVVVLSGSNATLVLQDITYTQGVSGISPSAITVAYTSGGTAGSEVVTVSGSSISIKIQSGTSTATQVLTAFNGSSAAIALLSAAVTGTGSHTQTSAVAAALTGGTPNVPKGKFIDVWQERLWIGDIQSARSSVRFNALVDTAGNDITPDDPVAWPNINEIECGEDDGDVICGFKVFLGILWPFKAKTIYRMDGQDEFTYAPFKTAAITGSRIQESIQERDTILEFIGKDGLYEFNGAQATKVSDIIDSVDLTQFSFSNIQQSSVQQKNRLWTSQADFAGCTLTRVTATRVPGAVIIDNFTYDGTVLPDSDAANPWVKSGGTPATASCTSGILTINAPATGAAQAGQQGHPSAMRYTRSESSLNNTNGTRMGINAKVNSSGAGDLMTLCIQDNAVAATIFIYPTQVLLMCSPFATPGSPDGTYVMNTTTGYHLYELVVQGTTATVYIDGVSQITASIVSTGQGVGGGSQTLSWSGGSAASFQSTSTGNFSIDYVSTIFYVSGTAQVISDVEHITDTISSWGAFQSSSTTNGGTVTFYVRSGTSSAACTAASWTAIIPGATIAFSVSNVYIQWRCDFTPSGTNSPELDDVTINWNTGNAGTLTTQGVASIVYKSRYWLAGALTGSSFNNSVLIRGKRIYNGPFITLTQFNLLAFCIFNNQLFAAASDSAALLQLDQDSSANGSALLSSWETRDELGGDDSIFNKRFPIIIVTGQRSGNYNLTVDISIDGGQSFPSIYTKTISLSGTGRFETELRYPSLRAKQVRVRVKTNGIDQPFEVQKITVFWRKTNFR